MKAAKLNPYDTGMETATPFRYLHRVTYSECTLGNHVYYARYLDQLEAARSALFRELGQSFLAWQEQGIIFPVVECRLRYQRPARYDEVLAIEIWPTVIQRVRLNFGYQITNADHLPILDAETFHACSNLSEKPCRLPAELVNRLTPFIRSKTA